MYIKLRFWIPAQKGRLYRLLPTPTKSDYKATFVTMDALTRYLKSGHQIRVSDILAQKGFLKSQRIALLEMMMGFPIGHTRVGSIGNAVNPCVAKYLFECIKGFDKQLA